MRLANGIIAVEFDDRTGSLVQIEDLRRGVRHLADPAGGRLLRIVVPDEENWIGRYSDSHESGRPTLTVQDGQAVIAFPDMKTPTGESTGVAATLTASLPAGADEIRFTVRIENRGPFLVHEVWYPRIGGWRGYAGPGKDSMLIGACTVVDPHACHSTQGYTLCSAHRRRFYGGFPSNPFPILDLSGGGRGLSMIHYSAGKRINGWVLMDQNEKSGGVLPEWSFVDFPFIKPGATWASDPVGVSCHNGDWHATSDRCRTWMESWWRPPAGPSDLRTRIGYFNLQFRDFEGRDIWPLSRAPEFARYNLEHGIRDLCLWDMIMNVYLRAGTGGFYEDRPERLAEMKRVLSEIRATGVQVSTLINLRLVTKKNSLWKEWGEARSIRSLYGAPLRESWPCRSGTAQFFNPHLEEDGHRLCQCHPDFQRWAIQMVERNLDLGFSSVFIDQPFGENVCFAPDHGHEVPASLHEGVCQWIAEAVKRVRARDPESYVIGENADLFNSQFIHLWWNWGFSGIKSEGLRYTLPDSTQSWILDAYEHGHEVGKAFALGFLFSMNVRGLELPLESAPDFAERVRQLAVLRSKTAAYTVSGRFLDRAGLTVDAGTDVAAGVYRNGSRGGIVLSDIKKEPGQGGLVKLIFQPEAAGLGMPSALALHRQDGRSETIRPTRSDERLTFDIRLGRWESAVLEI